jgi:hypothetical protein
MAAGTILVLQVTMIPETLVTETWQGSAQSSPSEARAAIGRLGRQQPALLAYVLAASEALSPAAGELMVYVFFVLSRVFYATGEKVRRVPPAAIDECEANIEARLTTLQGAHDAFVERAAFVLSGNQPHVFRYVVEAIMEAPSDPIDPIRLTPEEQGAIFIGLATAITALDQHGLSNPQP